MGRMISKSVSEQSVEKKRDLVRELRQIRYSSIRKRNMELLRHCLLKPRLAVPIGEEIELDLPTKGAL